MGKREVEYNPPTDKQIQELAQELGVVIENKRQRARMDEIFVCRRRVLYHIERNDTFMEIAKRRHVFVPKYEPKFPPKGTSIAKLHKWYWNEIFVAGEVNMECEKILSHIYDGDKM